MTSKQHEALAAAFKSFFQHTYGSIVDMETRRSILWGQWQPILDRVCIVLSADNPAFDKQRFLKECGVR